MPQQITALSVQKRNLQRVNVHLDGEFAFGLARIVAAWLHVGQMLSEEKIAELQVEDAKEVAFQQAIHLLQYRARTEAELRKHLVKHETPDAIIEHVIQRLRDGGLIDDAQFARTWVENRSELRPRSRRALAFELHQHGVDRELIDESLTEIDDSALAYQAAQRRAPRFANLEWKDFRIKMFRYLAQRGFNYDASAQAIAQVWQELSAERPSGEE